MYSCSISDNRTCNPVTVRRSARLATKHQTVHKESNVVASAKPEQTTVKVPWNATDVQNMQDLATFPTYIQLFYKYNLPLGIIPYKCKDIEIENRVSSNKGTDYSIAVSTYCYMLSSRNMINSTTIENMMHIYGLKDCEQYIRDNISPDRPSYDYKNHIIQFEPTSFDIKGAKLHASIPKYNPNEMKEARNADIQPLRKSSFILSMRMFLDKIDLIVANCNRYPSHKEYLEAKLINIQYQYKELLGMQDILIGTNYMRNFTLATESKAFELMDEICGHPKLCPIIASETLFVLRTYISTVRAFMTALED